jgi:hypothetical protein
MFWMLINVGAVKIDVERSSAAKNIYCQLAMSSECGYLSICCEDIMCNMTAYYCSIVAHVGLAWAQRALSIHLRGIAWQRWQDKEADRKSS